MVKFPAITNYNQRVRTVLYFSVQPCFWVDACSVFSSVEGGSAMSAIQAALLS